MGFRKVLIPKQQAPAPVQELMSRTEAEREEAVQNLSRNARITVSEALRLLELTSYDAADALSRVGKDILLS